MKRLPIGIQTFSKLKEENYYYVDKTEEIYNLITHAGSACFLSRPRRFGKSLLVSILREVFSGNKKLFEGLWIYDKIQWSQYPVITIDFTRISYNTGEQLKSSLRRHLEDVAKHHGITLNAEKDYKECLAELIAKMSTKGKVILLVDEYDKPIIDHIENKPLANENRNILQAFYETLKGVDSYLKFIFITGVSKFSKVSVFSGLNNLDDITLDERFSAILGYTEDDISRNFEKELLQLAHDWKVEPKELHAKVKRWYNGYSWDGDTRLYNPVSIHNFISKQSFSNYWFSTATPTFLVKLIRQKEVPVSGLEQIEIEESEFDSYDVDNIALTPLLFQTGYLTVSKVDIHFGEKTYFLSYPNQEVEESFLKHLYRDITQQETLLGSKQLRNLKKAIHQNSLPEFFKQISTIFASLPYDIVVKDREGYYQTVIYLILKLIGIDTATEIETNQGRLDAVIETATHVYIMEYKLDTAEKALAQIKEKKYYQKYLGRGKHITAIGVGFDIDERNISGYTTETVA